MNLHIKYACEIHGKKRNYSFKELSLHSTIFSKLVSCTVKKVICRWSSLNSLPKDNILDGSTLKAFADNKIKVTENFEFLL